MAERIALKIDSEYDWIEDRPNYDDIVATFGEIKAEASDSDYQGDSLYLIEKDGKYGIVTFGWGSCSGCDALQAANSQQDINDLQDDLESGIKWFDYDEEALDYLVQGGFKESFLRTSLVLEFANKVKAVLA